jgi:hypothetical protein
MNEEWTFAQSEPSEDFARLHWFSIRKRQPDGTNVEFTIRVREYARPRNDPNLRFFAEANPQTNQNTVPFTPCGWGHTLLKALTECIKSIERFPYEGPVSS